MIIPSSTVKIVQIGSVHLPPSGSPPEETNSTITCFSPEGYTAYFVEMSFTSPYVFSFTFTTGVQVVPDHLPYACDFDMNGCIDLADVHTFATQWLAEQPTYVDVYPTGLGDGQVDLLDLSVLSRNYGPAP